MSARMEVGEKKKGRREIFSLSPLIGLGRVVISELIA
jgi:hypothetical protein